MNESEIQMQKSFASAEPSLLGPGEADDSSFAQPAVKSAFQDALLDRAIPIAAFLAGLVVPWLPRFCVLMLARVAGSMMFVFMPRRRIRIALANLEVAFGESLSATRKRQVVRDSMCNMALVTLDLFWFSHRKERRLKKYLTFSTECDFESLPHRVVFVGAHFGNWELQVDALAMLGHRGVIPYAPLHQRAANQVLMRLRRNTGGDFVPRAGAGRHVIRALVEGRSVGLLVDQNRLPSHGGDFVDLFGLPVPAPSAVAKLARHSGAPICPLFCVPAPRGRYLVYFSTPRFVDDSGDLPTADTDRQVTHWIMSRFEEEIRRYPGSWLWTHRRWRYIPFGKVSFGKYPFYADRVIAPEGSSARRMKANMAG